MRVLGGCDADLDGRPVDLGGPRQRAVLALLLTARGAVVPADRVSEDLWRGEPPPRAAGALQAYVSHLRKALEPDRPPRAPATVLVSAAPGYAAPAARGAGRRVALRGARPRRAAGACRPTRRAPAAG